MSVQRLRRIDGPNNTPVKEKVDQILMRKNIVAPENIETNIIEEVKKKRGRPRKLVKKVYVKTGKKRGRPSSYSDKIARHFCNQMSRGRPLEAICGDENMPSLKTIFNWLDKNHPSFQKKFSDKYEMARWIQLNMILEKVNPIIDDLIESRDKMVLPKVITDQKKYVIAKKMERIRLKKIDLRVQYWKWRAQHLQPRKYAPDFF
jgi:hypothetical protein